MPNEPTLGLQLQSVTVQVDDVPHDVHYWAGEPEYVGRMPMRTDLEILPLPPDRDSQDDFGGHALQVTGLPEAGQVLIANSWGSDWGPAPAFDNHPQDIQADSTGGVLFIGGPPNQDISFYSKDRIEVLRITESGDFIVQGRLVKRDVDVYIAFRVFLGLSMGMPPEPGSRDGITTRYERILKMLNED